MRGSLFGLLLALLASDTIAQDRPNIVVVLLDDMGFSDLGCYGSEIRTPNIDGLARDGLRFTQFYNTARCCPTRASLLTGLYPHQAGVGWMMADSGHDGYRGELSRATRTIAERLRPAGYGTYMSGKWHVTRSTAAGGPKDNWPRARGFDRFFGTIHGAGSYYDPNSLTLDETQIPPGEGFYYTDAITDHAVRFIEEHQRTRAADPLFLYVAFTAPHWPMHALPADIARYQGRYDDGWDALRAARWRRQIELGLVDERQGLTDRDADVPAWADVEDAAWQRARMEVYASMIDRVDQNVGRLLQSLRDAGRYDDTLILLLADNGGCAEETGSRGPVRPDPSQPVTLRPMAADALQTRMQPEVTRDGRPVRTGAGVVPGPADTFVAYGKGWANASNTPFRRYKHWVHEGGIATPLIAHWPAAIARRGRLERQPGHVIDIAATCVDVAGADAAELEGRSLRPAFAGGEIEREALFWEHEGNRAVRVGDLKLVAAGRDAAWELYDLAVDRTERFDLAAERPDTVRALAARWQAWAQRAQVLPLTPYWQPRDETFSTAKSFTLRTGDVLGRDAAPNVEAARFRIEARVETEASDGVIVAQGGGSHGWALYLRDRVPHLALRRRGQLTVVRGGRAVGASFTLHATVGAGGRLGLGVDADAAVRGRAGGLLTQMPVDGLEVGRDDHGAVGDYEAPFALAGKIEVRIELLGP